jgi:hypothetical protein
MSAAPLASSSVNVPSPSRSTRKFEVLLKTT